MYCEINIRHGRVPPGSDIVAAIQAGRLGPDIPVTTAYTYSRRYHSTPPPSALCAHHFVRGCFVIALSVYGNISTYHLEGIGGRVPVQTLLQVAEEYSQQLVRALSAQLNTPGSLEAVRLFEDTGEEAGVEGRPQTWKAILGKQFSWKELKPKIASLATTGALVYLGLEDKKPRTVALVTLGIAAAIVIVEFVWKWFSERGKIEFEVKSR